MKIQNTPWSWGLLAGLIVFLAGIVATCTSCAASQMHTSAGFARTPQQQLSATYYVSTTCTFIDGSGGEMHGGTGVMVDPHHLLTARHVVECHDGGLPTVRVWRENDTRYEVLIQREWKTKDIAQLYSQFALPGTDAKLAHWLPHVGDAVCAHHASPHFGAACGEVTDLRVNNPDGDVEVSMLIEHGNSGSGVYIDGILVGIITHLVPCIPNVVDTCGGNFSSIAGIL